MSPAESGMSPLSPIRRQQPGNPQQEGAVGSAAVRHEPPTPPCYVVTARDDDSCERRPIATSDDLQAAIYNLVNQGTRAAAVASDAFNAAGDKQARGAGGAARPLITIRGLPAAFVPVLLDSPLGIDSAFVEAHAEGRRYRPAGVRRRRGAEAARYAHWDYPELVAGYRQGMAQKKSFPGFMNSSVAAELPGRRLGLARRPVVWPVSDADKGLAAVFCRASLWVSREVDVLFLDKPCWGAKSALGRANSGGQFTGNNISVGQEHGSRGDGTKGDAVTITQWKGEEMTSLERILRDSLSTARKDSGVLEVLEETAYEQWLELFEVLTLRRKVVRPEKTSLEWQVMQSLERNLDMARKGIARSHENGSDAEEGLAVVPDDWGVLMQRLRTRVEILAATSQCAAHKKPGSTAIWAPVHQERVTYVPGHRTDKETPSSQGSDDNQRAVDRVTYLGGILLPFSLVSGVLSMNEGFEPGQPLFWVFWVATIPLALFTVLVIYADKLRQVEVWDQVLDPSGSDSGDQGSTKSGGGSKVQENDKEKRKVAPAFGVSRHSRPQQPAPVTYSAGGDVVIDLGAPAAEMQQVSAESSDQDQEVISSDEDAPAEASYHPGWEKKQLGWKGAAMCILRMRKPLRVLDGMPTAAGEGPRGDWPGRRSNRTTESGSIPAST